MARKAFATIRDDIEVVLEDSGNAIFSTTDIDAAIKDGLREISDYVPLRVDHWLTARSKTRYVDLSSLTDVVEPNYAVYPLKLTDTLGNIIDDRDLDLNRRNVVYEGDTIRVLIRNTPTPTYTSDLTGTVTFTDGSTAISGSSTLFTSELKPGYFIKKNGKSIWYRVASVTDATNLVLSSAVVTADDGADTADSTDYWRADIVVNCDKIHHLTEQTDLAGAVKVAHAKGVWQLNADALGTGSMDANLMFTIAGVEGSYRLTSAATITTNAATLIFEPSLAGIAPDNAVITFQGSSLTAQLERILTQLAAAHLAIDWVGDGRTSLDTATSHMDTGDDTLNTVTLAANANRDYLAYAAGRLGFSSNLRTYSQWGWDKLSLALRDLRAISTPKIGHTYSRGTARSSEWLGFR